MASDAGVIITMVFDGGRSVGFMNGKSNVVTAPVESASGKTVR